MQIKTKKYTLQYLRGRVFYTSITRHSFYCIKIIEGKKDIRTLMISRDQQFTLPKLTASGKHADLLAIQIWTNKESQHFLQTLKTDSSNGMVTYNRQKEKRSSTIPQSNDLGKRTFQKQKLTLALYGIGE